MANKKANTNIRKQVNRSFIAFILVLLTASMGWANVTNQTAVLSSDLNGDGIAGIGDTITFSCRSTTTQTDQYPYINLGQFGNPYFALPQLAGNFYSAFLTISPGNVENNTAQTFQFVDEDGVRIGGSLLIDNRRPYSQYGPSATGGTGNGGYFKYGDSLTINIAMNSALDGDIPRANLSNIGLGTSQIFSRTGGTDSAPEYQLVLPFPANKEGVATGLQVTATDDAGNNRSWDLAVNYDTKAPEIISASVVNMTSGKTWVTSGDTIKIQAVIQNYDYDTVKASNTYLIPGGPVTMQKVSGGTPGAETVFEYIHYVQTTPTIQSIGTAFEITATDDVGNESNKKVSNFINVDTLPPEFAEPFGLTLTEKSGIIGDNIAIIGDEIHFLGNLSTLMNDVIITVDLSGIGGVSNQIIPFNNSATTTFELRYDIHQYTSEDSTPRAFTVYAKDTAGNEITRVTLPVIYVDNNPPLISAGQAANVNNPTKTVKHGDVLSIQANVTNLDNGSIWVDFERVGGTASSTLSPYSGSTYRLEHTVGDPASGMAYDQNVTFTIKATDNAGNTVQTLSNSIRIDNEPPKIMGTAYTSSPAISATHPYVRVNDQITFRVQLASSSSGIHDAETVQIDLSAFGETAPVTMTYDGIGSYTATVTVQPGTLNNQSYFNVIAKDNAENSVTSAINVMIDNKPPDVGPMVVNFMTDLNKSGVVNVGDRLEFIIPVPDQDYGTCTLDLSHVGGSSAQIINYDAVLQRYYYVHDCLAAAMENTSYVFRAIVSDKAGNTMNSLSPTMEVDCVPPTIEYASATYLEQKGKAGVVNIGDIVTVYAKVDLTRLDGGTPIINLTSLGGNAAQPLYDDGAHSDSLANDGIYGYEHTVLVGNTDGASQSMVVEITDNAGNRALKSTDPLFIDNKPLTITSCTNTQVYDNNGNTIVDLDGVYTTFPSIATDVLRLEVTINGAAGDIGTLTVDLTPLGYSTTASEVACIPISTGWRATADLTPLRGTTNNQDVALTVTLTDKNGNQVIQTCATTVKVDNSPAKLEMYPISFKVDNGRLNEANLNDVIQIKVRVNNHDGILPMIDFTNLYLANGLTPPSPTLFPPNAFGGNEYTYDWTVPEGLGTLASLTILAYDASGNMTYGYTNEIRFLSKTPVFANYPSTRADLTSDVVPTWGANNIANPGDQVTITCVLSSVYRTDNTPAATVLANVRSLVNSPADDSAASFNDGDPKTYWTPLTYQPFPISGAGNYVYRDTFTVQAGGIDTNIASFGVRVLHPDASSIVLASTTIQCDPDNPFGIDTLIPSVTNAHLDVLNENGDNIASNVINIDDLLQIGATIDKFSDPGSVTAVLLMPDNVTEIFQTPLYQMPATNYWEAQFRVATTTLTGWPSMDGVTANYRILVSDDAENFVNSSVKPATFTIDNNPPQITSSQLRVENRYAPNWVGNVGDGYTAAYGDRVAPDGLVASVTVLNAADLTGNGMAYVDLSPIDGTSTHRLGNVQNALTVYSNPLELATNTFDLATRTFYLYVRDGSGNRAVAEHQLAVDTKRPQLTGAFYNGTLLTMNFSELVDPVSVQGQLEFYRLGYKSDHADVQIPGAATKLNPKYDYVMEAYYTNSVNVMLSSYTKAIIADWGEKNLYISVSHNTSTGEAQYAGMAPTASDPLALDMAGNWLIPLPRTVATTPVTITNTYTTRPKLLGGSYNANSPAEKDFLYLDFDKDMDVTTISTDTLRNLSIWVNRGDPADTYLNRYRFISSAASDTIVGLDTTRRLKIRLSEQAQDWIAMNYTRTGSQIAFQINGSEYEPPKPTDPAPLIRDFDGNRITPIPYYNASAGTLIPLNTSFAVASSSLNLSGPQPILTIEFQNSPARKVRLYSDPYKNLAETIERSKDLPIDLSGVYLYAQADLTNGYFPLNTTNVDYAAFKTLNTDYASTTVHIPLTADALKTMLNWGTSKFYIACNNGAFKDLWGNSNIRYPVQGDQASPIAPIIYPLAIAAPSIRTLAVSPAVTSSAQGIQLAKGQPVGNFFYEVAFDTATLSADVYIPIDRTRVPVLEFYTQNDQVNAKDTATFINWSDHNQGGIVRTVARFANNSDLAASGNIQRKYSMVKVSNFTDVFSNSTSFSQTASLSYNLTDKDTSINGFQNASYPIMLDNQPPTAITAIPTGTIGITPANSQVFDVTFDEPMTQTVGTAWQPVLRLGDTSNTVMSFTFQNWVSSTTARFVNSAPFSSNTSQGTFTYYVSGGYDEAGNQGKSDVALAGQLYIRSRGPNIDSINVTTYQSTTAKYSSPTGNMTNYPFSPYVAPGIATITATFLTAPTNSTLWAHLYQGESSLASFPMTVSGLTGTAKWDGTIGGTLIGMTGPTKYDLRIYDDAGNEGSKRGSITYDGQKPKVSSWNYTNVKTYLGKAYFSPAVNSFVKVDVFGPSSGQELFMRLTGPVTPSSPGTATDSFPMTALSGGGYTISYDGQNTSVPAGTLTDGDYLVSLVDKAGNLAEPLGGSGNATSTLTVDRTAPTISSIQAFRVDNGAAVTRFNPRVTQLKIAVNTTDPTVASGTAMVRITAGSSLIKEIPLEGPPLIAVWDGTDTNLQPVVDGTYKVSVIDLAENVSTQATLDVAVVNSVFKITDVTQVDRNNIRLTFSHDVNATDAQNPNLYTITPSNPVGIGAASPIVVSGKTVTIPLNQPVTHALLYTVTITPGFRSIDDDPIAAGNNSAQFTADGQGPLIANITYDGLSSQKKFNIVFDETIDAVTSQQAGNYSLTSGTDTVAIESVSLRADLKSVTITAFDDIVETKNYTIVASGVKDLYGNYSNGDTARVTFQGQDITPPVLTITAFSNPANEYDISVAVSSNEDLSGAPTAVITQSGGTAVSLVLNAGPNNRLFIGGAHLDMNYPGVATIQVTGKDVSTNVGTANLSFSTAYVNASVRAEVKSPDNLLTAVFEPGTLKENSVVTIVPEGLTKVGESTSRAARIVPTVFANLTSTQLESIRASTIEGYGATELIPTGKAYTMNLPSGRMAGQALMQMSVDAEDLNPQVGLYVSDMNLGWKAVDATIENGQLRFAASSGGTFALMKDTLAPRVSIRTQITSEPIREAKPVFDWNLEELGSGVDVNSLVVVLNGKEFPAMINEEAGQVRFTPASALVGGDYTMSLKVADKAGNKTISPEIRFAVLPPVAIYEVVQYPNPARSKVALRVSTNRPDVDWGELEVKIYDVSGHKVADSSNLSLRAGFDGVRRTQDIVWNLRNQSGKYVANGVYIAKITLRDPDNWNQKSKYIHKIAVLR